MTSLKLFISLFAALVIPVNLSARTGVSILPENLSERSGVVGPNASVAPISAAGQSFAQAYRIAVSGTSTNIQSASLSWPTTRAVNRGDNLRVAFWARKVAPIDGANIRAFVEFERVGGPGAKSLHTVFPRGGAVWTKHIIPFKAAAGYDAGGARLRFQFAHGPREFEIGGLSLVNYGQNVNPRQLRLAAK